MEFSHYFEFYHYNHVNNSVHGYLFCGKFLYTFKKRFMIIIDVNSLLMLLYMVIYYVASLFIFLTNISAFHDNKRGKQSGCTFSHFHSDYWPIQIICALNMQSSDQKFIVCLVSNS